MESFKIETLKIAFLGGALNSAAGSAHYGAIRLVNRFEIVAGCFSRTHTVNHNTARQYNIEQDRVYNSLDELIEREQDNIDAIILLTPTDQHAAQVIQCLQAGIPIICEKALAVSVAEAHNIKNAVAETNGFLAVIYNYLGYPILRELKHMIAKGNIGRLHHIQIEMPQEGFQRLGLDEQPVKPQSWRLHDGNIPTLSLDLSVHLHMMIKYLSNETPLNVVALSQSYGNFTDVKDNISCMIDYSNDISCNMWYSKIAIGNRNGLAIRIYGETGSAEWIQENPEHLHMANNHGQRWIIDRGSLAVEVCNLPRYTRFKAGHPAGFIEAFANYYDDIADSLLLHKAGKADYHNEHCFGITEAIEGLELLDAIARSSSSKKWEPIVSSVIGSVE